ncbi:hypothetical protein QBC35DRAFT_515993 [Podospora australis]|uniref:Uncharacterized protein n=1 Tax=Podospora australis TaxID=1536484 RepID=A0AAN6WR34_9PEZI|nr:hypothetical protein QBC35DRAFT_515993 [Podospora australis]
MQFTKNLLALAALLPFALAAPAEVAELAAKLKPEISILGTVVVTTYRCFAVSGKRSIAASGGGCSVTTWSGTDCRGSSFSLPYQGCFSVLYGSVYPLLDKARKSAVLRG